MGLHEDLFTGALPTLGAQMSWQRRNASADEHRGNRGGGRAAG